MKPLFNILLLNLLIFSVFHSYSQNTALLKAGQELKAERSMYSKVFFKETGVHQALISGSPVHYQKNGSWEDINTSLVSTNEGYQNENNILKSYFPKSVGQSNKIKLNLDGKEISVLAKKEFVMGNAKGELTVLENGAENSFADSDKNKISYANVYENISDEYAVLNGELKNNVILEQIPGEISKSTLTYFGFRETMELPQGWKIISLNKNTPSITSSGLTITDEKGNVALSIPAPVFFDNYGLNSDGSSMVEGLYVISEKNAVWTIATLVPVDWLKNPGTKYPISLDPSVIIAGTTGGWQSPNNFVDSPGFVFVGVCCGNQTHRGWIKFSLAGLPTTSCITNVEIEVTMATENSTNPEVVLINDVTGAFGPYGAITPAAYNDFGNGFYTSFTIGGMGSYGYYSLGPSANTLLQSQIAGGWFQVAFQFNNEPSIDWKNMNGTASNLKVTYIAPPCTLPIELLSFDAKCYNGKTDLTWTTADQTDEDFIVERTEDGINFEEIGKVKASNSSQHYSFADTKQVKGTTYYSLKQNVLNADPRRLHLIAATCDKVGELTLSPNPNIGIFSIEGAAEDAEVIVTDVTGQVQSQTKISSAKTQIDLSAKENGIYFVQIISKNGITSKKVILNR
jgi:hypothetical protein